MTAAYIVFVKEAVSNEGEMTQYKAKVGRSFVGRKVDFLAVYGEFEALEGPAIEGVVILKFPSMEAARDWYGSPDYQEAARHRFKGAAYRALLVEGKH